jgi:hypothetical protein
MQTLDGLFHLKEVDITKRHHMAITPNDKHTILIRQSGMAISRTGLFTYDCAFLFIEYNLRQLLIQVLNRAFLFPDGVD